jgi:hypothetical protein
MIEYVFRPSRIVDGKRVLSRVFCGRYSLDKGAKPVRVSLNTPDREVARKRLRAIVVEKQREAEGIVAPKAVRVAAGTQLADLVHDYQADLRGRELNPKHVRDTTTRVRRMIGDNGWKLLSDVRPDTFVKWRAGLKLSPKSKKEFHLSANAFLNWLVQTDRLMVNPLAKVTSATSEVSDPSGKVVAASAAPLTADAHTNATLPTSECAHAQRDAHVFVRSGHSASLAVLCDEFVASVNVTDSESFSRVLSSLVTSWRKDEMAARAGIEPATK